jgi:hypothetical protein
VEEMKTNVMFGLLCCLLLSFQPMHSQERIKGKGRDGGTPMLNPAGIIDKAGGLHNKSNIGSFFENRGKLYARYISDGPTMEWPIGSGHEWVYRTNPFVGIPGNVIQGRYTTDEEWVAVAGYHNRDSAKVATSDKPFTWPWTGWPVKDINGNPVFVSNQDTYCVYSDSANKMGILGIQVNQTGYAFSAKSVRDAVFYIFDITNHSLQTYDSLYFGMYLDIDIGGSYVSGYKDDKLAFDKQRNRIYFYDNGWSDEWNAPTGLFGFILLQSPKVNGVELGITDMHYNVYNNDLDVDSVQYGIMSSAASLNASSLGSRYFHPGANAPNLHYDDPATIPSSGLDLVANVGSGPYRLAPGDTLRFITVYVAASDIGAMDRLTANIVNLYANNFAVAESQPPRSPRVNVSAGDRRVMITWDNSSEFFRDPFTKSFTFEGYRLYKSIDKGQHWDQIDRNANPTGPAYPVPFASFDRIDGVAPDVGLQHSYVDSAVTNGFEYWYAVTAYSKPDSLGVSLEGSIPTTSQDTTVGTGIPRSAAVGRTSVGATKVQQSGSGAANVLFDIEPLDVAQAAGLAYDVSFAPVVSVAKGDLISTIQISLDSIGAKTSETFSLTFTTPARYTLRNLTEAKVITAAGAYASGVPILFQGLRLVLTDTTSLASLRPSTGDSLVIQLGLRVATGSTEVLRLAPLTYGMQYATVNGVIFSIQRADTLAQSLITYNDRFDFSTTAAQVSQSISGTDLDRVKVVPNPYMIASQYEPEFGAVRREPIRALKFNNLPARCTIYIFTLAGDKVKTIDHNSDNGTETWDMRAAGNREIAPGVYIYLVKTDTAEKIGRFAVIK